MKKHLRWIVFALWVLFDFFVIVRRTPELVGTVLTVGGTILVMRVTSHCLYYGREGLKFWRWGHQPTPHE